MHYGKPRCTMLSNIISYPLLKNNDECNLSTKQMHTHILRNSFFVFSMVVCVSAASTSSTTKSLMKRKESHKLSQVGHDSFRAYSYLLNTITCPFIQISCEFADFNKLLNLFNCFRSHYLIVLF